jgi:hypothetical protein
MAIGASFMAFPSLSQSFHGFAVRFLQHRLQFIITYHSTLHSLRSSHNS